MAKKRTAPAKRTSKPAPRRAKKKTAAPKARKPSVDRGTVSSGPGASPADLGRKLVELFNQNKADDWIKSVWSRDVESIEGTGQVHRGPKQILAKWDWWTGNHEVLGASAEGPYVGATGFAVRYQLHVKDKATGSDISMSEVAVYSVKNGRITREEFMYGG